MTYPYPPQLSYNQPLPSLSDNNLQPYSSNDIFSQFGFDQEPLADQYRSTQLQSPTFSVSDSEASTTVSPRDVFADDHIAHKHYPSLFNPSRTSTPRSVETSSPLTPAEDAVLGRPSSLVPDRQHSILSQSSFASYASTSSEDEDAPATMILPEPKGHGHSHSYPHSASHSYPKHARSTSLNNSTLSPSMALLATGSSPKWSPNGNNVVVGGSSSSSHRPTTMHFGFKPLEPESTTAEPTSDQVENAAYSAPIVPAVPYERKRGSPFGDREEDEEDSYRSSASDASDDDEYTERRSAVRRNSSVGHSTQRPKKIKINKARASDPYARPANVSRNSNGESAPAPRARAASVAREGSTEPSFFCNFTDPSTNLACSAGFVRIYDLKRVSSADVPTFELPADHPFTDWLRTSLSTPSSPQHESTIHSRDSVPPSTPGEAARPTVHRCDQCDRTFSRKDALIRHWKTIDHSIPVSQRRGPGGGGGAKKR